MIRFKTVLIKPSWDRYNFSCGGGGVRGYYTLIFQLYRGGQFHWWGEPEYLENSTDKLYHTSP